MNPIVNFSPYGGQLIKENVLGITSGKINPENNVETVLGSDRDMFVYVPASGCPHAKQTQVLMVLRDENTKESAQKIIEELKLDELAENENFILVFPNPHKDGWNYTQDSSRDNDIQYLVRCFAALPKSKGKVAGFNGMIFHLATSSKSSAMAMTLAANSPLDAAAIMISEFPEEYNIPAAHNAEQVAWVYGENKAAVDYFKTVNKVDTFTVSNNINIYQNDKNNAVKFYVSKERLSASEVEKGWDKMFSETRRWRNDTYGTYQKRINYTGKNYRTFYKDKSLKVNDNHEHTWFEYVPENIKKAKEKVPLVLFFHGINCVGLYGAEQSGWSDLADRDNFIVVYPDPSIEERWNVWDDPRLPSDVSFVMALIEKMKEKYPIDEKRIYISGFSMGSMFTNALAASYPEVFLYLHFEIEES